MNQLDGTLILLFLPLALLFSGYWLAAPLTHNTATERLALAVLFGLGLLLAAVAAINVHYPLSGVWAYLCLLPALPSLLPRHLVALGRDVAGVWRSRPGPVVLSLAAYLVLLLWPVLRAPSSLFYDGTSNHDSFFWVAGAEHLKRHSYFELPEPTPTQPLTSTAAAIIGWHPAWGRMGAEGLLALASSVIGVSPLKLYLYATACLYFAWLAGAWLALRTFVTDRPGRGVGLVLAGLQPVFLFFYGNNNLPNLLGAVLGASFVIAFERALRSKAAGRADSDSYLILTALSFHGVLCAYPEIVPFILLPAGLLWLRHWIRAGLRPGWPPCLLAGGAVLLGVALNAATTIRAYHGFTASLKLARADENWANLFNPLVLAEYVPGLVTLSVPAARQLGPWLGWPLSVILVAAALLLWRRARDRFGLFAIFSGSTTLILYTIVTHFAYGWQKTVQFSGVMFGMVFPAALVHVLLEGWPTAGRTQRALIATGLAALLGFMVFATAMHYREVYKWSDRKVISADWFDLRDLARTELRDAPILIEAATFPMAFFHSMWAPYFLTENHVYYGARGEQSGGYLRGEVVNEANQPIPPPAAYVVGRRWAETFDANSPRLLTGREYVLLSRANRLHDLSGVYPLNGVPERASSHLVLVLTPALTSALTLTLAPAPGEHPAAPDATWQLRRETADGQVYTAEVGGPPPWSLSVPLVGRQRQTVTITTTATATEEYPYEISGLQIKRMPAPLSPVDGTLEFAPTGDWPDYAQAGLQAIAGQGVVTGPAGASLQFVATPATDDLELEMSATLPPTAAPGTMLATELWFNDSLIFTGFFGGPGVLRARIFHEHWNQRPLGQFRLRFPQNRAPGPALLLQRLTLRRTTSPRP